jgi:hypothetical protein
LHIFVYMSSNRKNLNLTYFIIGFLLALFFTFITCEATGGFGVPDRNDKVEVDTVYVDRVIKVPGKSGSFETIKPNPKTVYQADPVLLKKYQSLKTEKERLEAYIYAITKRKYEKVYTSKDSIVTITVNDSVTGTLDWQGVAFDIKPRDVIIKEKIITNTIEKYPDFSLMVGAGARAPLNFNQPMAFELTLGVEDNKGFTYQVSYDTQQYVGFRLTKKLFTKF